MKTFGEIALKWPFGEEKKEYIKTNVFQDTGPCSIVYREHGLYCDLPIVLLQFLEKNLQISGYRLTERPFREKALTKLMREVEKKNQKFERVFWDIYEIASIHYLNNKEKFLNRLMLNEHPTEEIRDALHFFKQLALFAPKYSVSKESILNFNNIWKFEVSEDISRVIFNDEYEAVSISAKILEDFKSQDFEPVKSRIAELEKLYSIMDSKLDVAGDLAGIKERVDSAFTELEKLRIEFTNRISAVPPKVGQEIHILSKSFDELRAVVTKNPGVASLKVRVEGLEKKLSHLGSEPKSKLIKEDKLPERLVADQREANDEKIFIEMFFRKLKSQDGTKAITLEEAIITHCFLSSCSALTIKDSSMLEAWLSLHKGVQVKSIYPEATWIDSSQLPKSFSEDPTIFLIHNFDIGIYDAYAAPWLAMLEKENPSKIKTIFISGDYSDSIPSAGFLRYSPILTLHEIELIRTRNLKLEKSVGSGKSAPQPIHYKQNFHDIPDYIETLHTFLKANRCEVPIELLKIAYGIAKHLRFYFDEKTSIVVSTEIVIVPYCLRKFGVESANSFVRSISTMLDNRIAI